MYQMLNENSHLIELIKKLSNFSIIRAYEMRVFSVGKIDLQNYESTNKTHFCDILKP